MPFVFVWLLGPPDAKACPFCVSLEPTVVQQRESANSSFLGECVETPGGGRDGKHGFQVKLRFAGDRKSDDRPISVVLDEATPVGALASLVGDRDASGELRWRCQPLDEVGFAYIARAPDSRVPSAQRLRYFAKFLEHRNAWIAQDAYFEFGYARYEDVAQAAAALDAKKLRSWMAASDVPPERKGFYGLALGLTAVGEEREANLALLRQWIDAEAKPGDDFRAGFDGVLGGYLVAMGKEGIEHVSRRYFENEQAAIGDVRHAQAAMRFYHEFGVDEHREQVAEAVRKLAVRSAFAAAAITDLARWEDWGMLDEIAALYGRPGFDTPDIRRAIVGYLRTCPLPAANDRLEDLRRLDPESVSAAEQSLDILSGRN